MSIYLLCMQCSLIHNTCLCVYTLFMQSESLHMFELNLSDSCRSSTFTSKEILISGSVSLTSPHIVCCELRSVCCLSFSNSVQLDAPQNPLQIGLIHITFSQHFNKYSNIQFFQSRLDLNIRLKPHLFYKYCGILSSCRLCGF